MASITPGNKVLFTFYNYDAGIFMDEKKKRFMDFKDMDKMSYFRYRNQFKKVS